MNRWIWPAAVMVSVVGVSSINTRACVAGPLSDWLSGRAPYYQRQPWHIDQRSPRTLQQPPTQPQPVYGTLPASAYPRSVVYQQPPVVVPRPQAAPGVFQPTPNFQQTQVMQSTPAAAPTVVAPTVAAPPATYPLNTYPLATYPQSPAPRRTWCQWFRSWCSPRRTYRSSWARVPVTRYRPAPATAQTAYGVPATQACNGSTWQMRRVPTTWPFSGCGATTRQPASYFGTQVTDPCVTYGTAIPQTAPPGTPYYPTPSATVPGTTTVVPTPGLGTTPANPGPTLAPPGSGPTPADRAPSLNPNGIAPSRSLLVPVPPTTKVPPAASPAATNPPATAPATSEAQGSPRPSQDAQATITPPPAPRLAPPPIAPTSPQRFDNYFNVTPIRDPEAMSNDGGIDGSPRLLAPDNHSAARDPINHSAARDSIDHVPAWQVVPVTWEAADRPIAESQPAAPRPAIGSATPAASPRRNFDDSGWQTARSW